MKRMTIGILSIVTVAIVIFSSVTVFSYSHQPESIAPEAASNFIHFINETKPTGFGYFNASILGSTAEFGYAFYFTGNSTIISSGYVVGFQIAISILSEKLSPATRGFSAYISKAYADYGVQHFQILNKTTTGKGVIGFDQMIHGLGKNRQIELFTSSLFGSPITFHSTYNLSFYINPVLMIGPYTFTEGSFHVNKTLAIIS